MAHNRPKVIYHADGVKVTQFDSLVFRRPHPYFDASPSGIGVPHRTAVITFAREGVGVVLGDHYHLPSPDGFTETSRSPEILFLIHGAAWLDTVTVQHRPGAAPGSPAGRPIDVPNRMMLQPGMRVQIDGLVHHTLTIVRSPIVYLEYLMCPEDVEHDNKFLLERGREQ